MTLNDVEYYAYLTEEKERKTEHVSERDGAIRTSFFKSRPPGMSLRSRQRIGAV